MMEIRYYQSWGLPKSWPILSSRTLSCVEGHPGSNPDLGLSSHPRWVSGVEPHPGSNSRSWPILQSFPSWFISKSWPILPSLSSWFIPKSWPILSSSLGERRRTPILVQIPILTHKKIYCLMSTVLCLSHSSFKLLTGLILPILRA